MVVKLQIRATIKSLHTLSLSMQEEKGVLFIATGGTIDSVWDGRNDTVVPNKHSIIPYYIAQLKPYIKVGFLECCMKDSRDLTPKDIKRLCQIVKDSKHKRIIIAHGTYTMDTTARYLKKNLKRRDQTIILTGSMTPLKGFELSDAGFNLGYAYAQSQNLPAGIYLCMNGYTFTPEEVAKNLPEGRFYSLFKGKQ